MTTIDGVAVTSDSAFQAVRGAHHPGDQIPVEYLSRGQPRTATLTVAEDARLEVVTYEEAGRTPTGAMLALRKAWLGGRGPTDACVPPLAL